jgi:hypothetical protein
MEGAGANEDPASAFNQGLPEFNQNAAHKGNKEDQSGIELKNYIKEMNKFLDEPAHKKHKASIKAGNR